MVNLIGPRASKPELVCLEAEPGGRVEARLRTVAALAGRRGLEGLRAAEEALESELEELAQAPSRECALALLEAIEARRRAAGATAPEGGGPVGAPGALLARGDYVGHRPGRSLATGEAEIASRGYFDVEDRPPLASWIGLLVSAPRTPARDEALVVVAWVPESVLERARAGCRACPNGALVPLAEIAPEAHRLLRALEARLAGGCG